MLVVVLRAIVQAWLCSVTALAIWSPWADCSTAAEESSASIIKRYDVEPTAASVLGVLRQWQPSAENRARIDRLVRELGDENWAVREAASRHLADMGSLAEAALRNAVEQSRDAEVVIRARKLLAERRQGRAEELLSASLQWLRETPTPQATPLLLELLPALPNTLETPLREALWACAGPDDVPRLRRAISNERPEVRIAAIIALEQAAGDVAVRDLAPLLSDKNESIRLAAARALLDRRPRTSIGTLLELLDAKQPGVRQQAAWLLQQVSGIPNAAEPLPDLAAAAARWNAWAATDAAGHPRPLGRKRLQACQYARYPFVPGKLGNAVALDGRDSYVDFGNPLDNHLDIGANATIEVWVRFDALPSNSFATLVSKDEGPYSTNKWIFAYVHGYDGRPNTTVMHYNVAGSTNALWICSNPWTPVIGRWCHLAVVKRGHQFTFYRDGLADGKSSMGVEIPRVNFALQMGQCESSFRLQGALDDVRMWNRDLTGDQIHAKMNSELTGGEAGLVGYWTMNGGSGTTVADSTRFGVNGTYKGRMGATATGP
jgi:HEAT repeat protein